MASSCLYNKLAFLLELFLQYFSTVSVVIDFQDLPLMKLLCNLSLNLFNRIQVRI